MCTTKANKHTDCGFSIFVECGYDKSKNEQCIYQGDNYTSKFRDIMSNVLLKLTNIKYEEMIPLIIEEFESWKCSNICYMFKEEFNSKKGFKKVKYYCYLTRQYESAAHCTKPNSQ